MLESMWDDDREYNDDYATCERTYVTLCVYHESQPSASVTEALGLVPDRTIDAHMSAQGFPKPTFRRSATERCSQSPLDFSAGPWPFTRSRTGVAGADPLG